MSAVEINSVTWLSRTASKLNLPYVLQIYFMNRFVSIPEIKSWRFKITVFYTSYGHMFDQFPPQTQNVC